MQNFVYCLLDPLLRTVSSVRFRAARLAGVGVGVSIGIGVDVAVAVAIAISLLARSKRLCFVYFVEYVCFIANDLGFLYGFEVIRADKNPFYGWAATF